MNNRGYGRPYQHRAGDRFYSEQHESEGSHPHQRPATEQQRGAGGRPRGLRGKDIGLWYARRGKMRREHGQRVHVRIDEDSITSINQLLDKHGNGKGSSESRPSTSAAAAACDTHSPDDLHMNAISSESKQRQLPSIFDEDLPDFAYDYAENLKLNDLQGRDDVTTSAVVSSGLVNDESLNKSLKEKMLSIEKTKRGHLSTFREKLPAYDLRKRIVSEIRNNQVVVISGETGCGKTTQVPQFILDDMVETGNGSVCNIICTQPRRISATSVAERVAIERGEVLGQSVGYSIRLENRSARGYASITFCTTGVLLRRLRSDRCLLNLSHVIVDEVHERDTQTDFLLVLVRDLLPLRPDLKVILMSATLNAEKFSEYFYNAPMLHIPGFTYPVTEYYLEDVIDTVNYFPEFSLRLKSSNKVRRGTALKHAALRSADELSNLRLSLEDCGSLSLSGRNAIMAMDHTKVHPDLVASLIKDICKSKPAGAILVFLPGWADITAVNSLLMSSLNDTNVVIIPLHSLMPTSHQKSVFDRPPPGVRKIVLATNIAETSITIDDIVYVIDCGKIKMTDFDAASNVYTLDACWVSRANVTQRRGRAGRVQPGICYHLFTRYHDNKLDDYQRPEMLRTRLENVCLDVKLLGQGKVEPFLRKAMDSPSKAAIESSIGLLVTLNALDHQERLTPLGFHLARMPLDPHTAKMVLMSAIFSCMDPILTIAACLNFKDPFHIPMDKVREVDKVRYNLSQGSNSDHLMYYYAIQGWEAAHNRRDYAYRNFISHNTADLIIKMKKQFAELLCDLKFIANPDPRDKSANRNSGNKNLIRAILCSGLYPNVAKVSRRGKSGCVYSTKTEKRVDLHLKSVNSKTCVIDISQWVVYYEMIRLGSSTCLMECTPMPAFPILFFGEEMKKVLSGDGEIVEKYEAVTVNDFITISCAWSYADLILRLRNHLNEVLEEKISNPSASNWDESTKEGATLQAIVDMISKEQLGTMKTH